LRGYLYFCRVKKVLVLYYTQSGQLEDIVNSFCLPFSEQGIWVEKIAVIPKNDFPFPWSSDTFFDAMPESVLVIPTELQPIESKESQYDLVIIGYQPWFLSPSIPANSMLQDEKIKNILKQAPVVTLIGARNMWLNAQEKMKKLLSDSGANLVGNIALVDRNSNLASAVSILHWMMSGKKEKYLGIFPKPGVSDKDIAHAKIFGATVAARLQTGNYEGMQQQLVNQKAVEIQPNLMFIEQRAGKLFSIWANFIVKKKNRRAWLRVFKYYLLIALFIVAPVVLTVNFIFFRPFSGKSIQEKKHYYLGLS
jgi:hypothetical protein